MQCERHDRTRLVLQELGVTDASRVLQRILEHSVCLFVDDSALQDHGRRTMAQFTWKLLCRTFQRLSLIVDTANQEGRALAEECLQEANAVQSSAMVGSRDVVPAATVVLCLGDAEERPENIYFACDGWNAHVSRSYVPATNSPNPIGGLATACLAVAASFRALLEREAPNVVHARPLLPVHLNTLTYTGESEPNPPFPSAPDLGDIVMVGGGAVAQTAIAALIAAGARGRLDLLDTDTVDLTNLNRYVMSRIEHLGQPKTEVLASQLNGTGLKTMALRMTYQTFSHMFGAPLGTVVCTADNDFARHAIQRDLPSLIFEGATSQTNVAVGRYDFLEGACLSCRHPEPDDRMAVEEAIAARLRWPLQLVLSHLVTDRPLSEAEAQGVAEALDIPAVKATDLVGMPLRAIWVREACGRLGGASKDARDAKFGAVSFVSGLAGVLVAGELIKEQYFPEYCLRGGFQMNVLVGLSPFSLQRWKKADTCPSLCSDPLMQKAYQHRKYRSGEEVVKWETED